MMRPVALLFAAMTLAFSACIEDQSRQEGESCWEDSDCVYECYRDVNGACDYLVCEDRKCEYTNGASYKPKPEPKPKPDVTVDDGMICTTIPGNAYCLPYDVCCPSHTSDGCYYEADGRRYMCDPNDCTAAAERLLEDICTF